MIKTIVIVALSLAGILPVGEYFISKKQDRQEIFVPKKPIIAENVVILVIDGPRYSETFGEPTRQYIPNFRDSLLPQGTFFNQFYNEGSTFTNAGHASITTGRYQKVENSGLEVPKYPSIFQYYMRDKKRNYNDAWIITSKGKLDILANSSYKGWENTNLARTWCGPEGEGYGYGNDAYTMQIVDSVIDHFHPRLLLVNLLEVDVQGHAGNWEGYLSGIRSTDQQALALWNKLQSDPIYRNKTALFITNDHGRHCDGKKDGFVSHGGGCECCRHISLTALGPDFPKGKVISEKHEMIDVTATAAAILGLNMPTSRGQVIRPLFAN
ncbi:MAG: sulfatase [Crocinitomicaceae bacterium]